MIAWGVFYEQHESCMQEVLVGLWKKKHDLRAIITSLAINSHVL